MLRLAHAVTTAVLLLAQPGHAKTLTAGQGAAYPNFVAALTDARPGDTIHLTAGDYFECASLSQDRLVIEGEGPATTLTDRACEGKAALVIRGNGVQVRNLTLARQRVPDGNGAGIRLEGQGLTLDHVHFDNDEVGLLAQQPGPGEIHVLDCTFEKGGVAGLHPTAALMVGAVALLHVERSSFQEVKGAQITTAAARTELIGNRIATGVEPGAGTAVDASGGALLMQDNILVIGPNAPPHDAAIVIQGSAADFRNNALQNGTGHPLTLVLDWMQATPVFANNTIPPGDTLSSTSGAWRHRLGILARGTYAGARDLAGTAKRGAAGLIGR